MPDTLVRVTDEQSDELPAIPEARTLGEAIMGTGDFKLPSEIMEMIKSTTQFEADSRAQTEQTLNMIRNSPEARTARASQTTAESLSLLVAQSKLADQREERMLFWTRVSAIAAIAAVIFAAIGIIVTFAVA